VSDVLRPDRSFGVFETLLVVDGSPIELEAHLDRLARSVRDLFDADLPEGTSQLAFDGARPLELGRLRLTVVPGAGRTLAADAATASVDARDVFPSWERATALRSLVLEAGLGAHKWADRTWLEGIESAQSAGSVPLLVDAGGEVLEASRSNVFAVEGEVLITPAADGRILAGVARARAIEIARSLGVELREEALSMQRLVAAEGAFLTNSVRGVEPVRSVDGAELEAPHVTVHEIAAEMKRIWIAKDASLRAHTP
jgi:para-aminobenzoate synthetase / 4-amino-4-deoxychorismate lyase